MSPWYTLLVVFLLGAVASWGERKVLSLTLLGILVLGATAAADAAVVPLPGDKQGIALYAPLSAQGPGRVEYWASYSRRRLPTVPVPPAIALLGSALGVALVLPRRRA